MNARLPAAIAAVFVAAGAARAAEPAPTVPTDAQFFGELAYKDVATAADTARALVILVSEGERMGGDFEADKQYLTERGILPDGWLEEAGPDDPTQKGHLARLVCRTLGIRGGLIMRLLGPVPRYALRECSYLELMVQGAEYAHVKGAELTGVISRADEFRLKQAGQKPPELEGEPSGAAEEEE